LNKESRDQFLERQTASSPEGWKLLMSQQRFAECLEALEKRIKQRIGGPQEFTKGANLEQDKAIMTMKTTLSYFAEIDTLMTIYLWLIDDEAIFSIPTFGQGKYAIEYAFKTKDVKFIEAIRSLWDRYKEGSKILTDDTRKGLKPA
jgi:hypothetical protein